MQIADYDMRLPALSYAGFSSLLHNNFHVPAKFINLSGRQAGPVLSSATSAQFAFPSCQAPGQWLGRGWSQLQGKLSQGRTLLLSGAIHKGNPQMGFVSLGIGHLILSLLTSLDEISISIDITLTLLTSITNHM